MFFDFLRQCFSEKPVEIRGICRFVILGRVMFEASTIARQVLGLKFKVGKCVGKGDGT